MMSTERAGMALVLQMPKELITLDERLRFCEVVREKLRRTHNDWGALYAAGRISEQEWQKFLATMFDPCNRAVDTAILALRAEPKEAARALPDDDKEMVVVDLAKCFAEVL